MINEGAMVRVTTGENKGKIGEVIGFIQMGPGQHVIGGQELSFKGATKLVVVEFDNGEQDLLEESNLEVAPESA